jgi:hypothetical protein
MNSLNWLVKNIADAEDSFSVIGFGDTFFTYFWRSALFGGFISYYSTFLSYSCPGCYAELPK